MGRQIRRIDIRLASDSMPLVVSSSIDHLLESLSLAELPLERLNMSLYGPTIWSVLRRAQIFLVRFNRFGQVSEIFVRTTEIGIQVRIRIRSVRSLYLVQECDSACVVAVTKCSLRFENQRLKRL